MAKGGAGRSGAHWVRGLVAGALLAPLLAAVPPAARATGTTERVSLDDAEVEGNGASTEVAVSDDGNHIAFVSEASNLVAGDTNGEADVFVRNRATGTTVRVSVATDGTQALNDPSPDGKALSAHPAISPNGRFVVFQSEADNLIGALQDTNASRDVFVHDRDTDNDGTFDEAGAVSTTLVSVHHDTGQEAAGDSWRPAVSSTGRYVAFDTRASLVVADAVANSSDVYVRDRDADGDGIFDEAGLGDTATILVSVESDEVIGNNSSASAAISPDGRYVAFDSVATNLVSGDTNAKRDVFLRDRTSGTTVRASLADDETESNDDSNNPDVSSDGRYVVFDSAATDLVTGDTNGVREVFLRDLTGATTARVSVANDGSQSTGGESSFPSMSDDARYVAFHSAATNLVTGDANAVNDVFVRDRQTPSTVRISVASAGTEGNGASLGASLGSNGAFAAYESVATNLVSGDANALSDAFVHQVEYPPPTTTTTTTTTAVSPTTTTTTPTPTTTTTTASPTTTTTVPASTTTTTTVPASTTTTTAPPGGTTTTLPVATTVPLPPASPSIPGVSPAPSSDGSTPFGPGSSKPPLVQVELSRRAEPVVGAPARGSAKRWLWDSSTPIVVLATVSLFGAVGVLLLVGGLGAALFFPFPLRRRRREDGDDPPGPA